MATYIQNLLNNALGDGARASKFDVDIVFTNSSLLNDSGVVATLVKATSFPGKQHDIIDFKYKGRSIPLKGQTKYAQTWQCTFYLTEDHWLKNAFEVWIESLDQQHNYPDPHFVAGLTAQQQKNLAGYTGAINLFQKNFNNDQDTAHYTLLNCFPIEVSAVEYSAESVGQVQEFTVTFAYTHYVMSVVKGKDGNFIDQFVDNAIAQATGIFNQGFEAIGNLAGDAIGKASAALGSAFKSDLTNLTTLANQSAAKIAQQVAITKDSMVSSIDDFINK